MRLKTKRRIGGRRNNSKERKERGKVYPEIQARANFNNGDFQAVINEFAEYVLLEMIMGARKTKGRRDGGKADKQKGTERCGINEEVVDGYNSSYFIVRRGKCGATRIERQADILLLPRPTIDSGCFVYP